MTSSRAFCRCCLTNYHCSKLEIFIWEGFRIYLLVLIFSLFIPEPPNFELFLDYKLYLPFYRLNYKYLDLYVDRASEHDLNNVLHNEQNSYSTRAEFVAYIDPRCVMQSRVYVGMFEHAYFGNLCSDGIFHIEFYANESKNELIKTKVVGSFDIGVHYVQRYNMWGHLIHDFCASLMYLPEELHNKHFCIKSSGLHYNQTVEWIKFFGFKATVLDLKKDEQVYVDKLYFITGCEFSHSVSVGGIRRLREYVRKKLNLEKVKPCKFYILNREKNRTISNIDEVLTAFIKNVPIDQGQQWQTMVPPIKDIASNGRFWSEIKVLMAPCGSMIYNSIYMSEGTGLLLLYSHIDLPNFQLSIISKFYMIAIYYHLDIYDPTCKFTVQIPIAIGYMKQIVFAVNNNRWNKNHFHLQPPFHINKHYYYNYDKIYDFNFEKNRFKKNINITDKENEKENINITDKKTEKENSNNNKKKKKETNPDSYMTFPLGSIITNMMLLP